MEKNMKFKNITVANSEMAVVNIDNLPNWRSNAICSKKNIPQIFCNDGYWISVQDIIRAEAGEHEETMNVHNISCTYIEDNNSLVLQLYGTWTYNQISCLFTIFNVSGEAPCISSTMDDYGRYVLYIVINLEHDIVKEC